MSDKVKEKDELTLPEVGYVLEFAKNLNAWNYSNPLLANDYLKRKGQNPYSIDMERIRDMVAKPEQFGNQLISFSQYCYNTQMPFRRLVDYYASILTFDYTVYPLNATEKMVATDAFAKSYYKSLEFVEKLNPKKTFRKLMNRIIREDVVFTYVREDENVIELQRMPTDYCIIDGETPYGYLYSFDLSYFQQPGVNLNDFPKEFTKYYNDMLDIKKSNNTTYNPSIRPEFRKGRWCYWQQIPLGKGWVFKFNFDDAVVNPPLSSLFISAAEIDNYRQLQKNKDMLEAYKIIMGVIPRDKNPAGGNKKDNIAIQPETAALFAHAVQAALPDGIDFKVVPFEQLEMFEFAKSGEDLISQSINQLYSNSGTTSYLFSGGDKTNASTIKATQQTDASFVEHMYMQFESMINYYFYKLPGRAKFRVRFEGNKWDRADRQDIILRYAQSAMPSIQSLAASIGMSPLEFERHLDINKVTNFANKFLVIPTSYTQSGSSTSSTNPSDSAEKTADAGSNIDKKEGGF